MPRCSCHVNIPSLLLLSGVILVLQASLLMRMLPPITDPNDDDVGHHYDEEIFHIMPMTTTKRPAAEPHNLLRHHEKSRTGSAGTVGETPTTLGPRPAESSSEGALSNSKQPFIPTYHSYPRWGESRAIDFGSFAQYLENDLISQTQHFPDTLYLIQNSTLWVSKSIRKQHFGYFDSDRIKPVESLMYEAVQYLVQCERNDERWKALRESLDAGVPVVVNYRDYSGCGGRNRQELVENKSNSTALSMLPIFTMCATVSPDCDYAFPIPTYFVIQTAKQNWTTLMNEQQPFHLKHKKAVWRGAFTGRSWNHGLDNQRSSMYHLAQNHTDILDVEQATKGPPHNEHFMPMEQFRNYRAVLDLDGDAWSKRFVQLLCYSSVVIKVEPQYVDYFHPELRPWTHYIPVRADLSDLVEKVSYAVSDEHQNDILRIIENAQQWCAQHVVQKTLIEDMLDIWATYVEFLNRGDSRNWQQNWIEIKGKLDSQGVDMVPFRAVGTARLSREPGAVEWTKLQWKQA